MAMAVRVQFPPQEYVASYLDAYSENEPAAATYPCLKDRELIEKEARTFASQYRALDSIQTSVALVLGGLNQKLQLTDAALATVMQHLTKALIDCANGVPVVTERATT